MKQSKRLLVVSLIVLLAIGGGILLNFLWNTVEKETHPKDFEKFVKQYSEEYDVPVSLVYAVIKTESNFDPRARSSVGALGLMQMMPKTFEWLAGEEHLNEKLPVSSLYTPEISIRYGVYYLHYLYDKFENWDVVLAAYNGGEGNVAKWLKDPKYSDENGNLTYIPFEETRRYVEKVKSAQATYEELYSSKSQTKNGKETV